MFRSRATNAGFFKNSISCAALTFALLSGSSATAEDRQIEILRQLYTRLGGAFRTGDNTLTMGRTYLVLLNPGILIDPDLNLATDDAGRYALYTTLDQVLAPDWVYATKPTTSSRIYQNILRHHVTPTFQYSADQLKRIDEAKKYLFSDWDKRTPSPEYERYKEKAAALAVAQDVIYDFKANNPGKQPPAVKLTAYKQALADYNLVGDAPVVIAHENELSRLGYINPETYWAELQTQYDLSIQKFGGASYGDYQFYPGYKQWSKSDAIWQTLTMTEKDLKNTVTSGSSSSSVGGGAGWGLWSVSANYGESRNWRYEANDVKDFTIAGQFARVSILRPWMEYSVFESDAWQWQKNAPAVDTSPISDGADASAGKVPSGQMPFLPVGLLIAKNVRLSGSFEKNIDNFFHSESSGGGSVGWGPFSFSGRTSRSETNTFKEAKTDASGIEIGQPQIVGMFVHVLPPSPRPNLAYKWPEGYGPQNGILASGHLNNFSITGFTATIEPSEDPLKRGALELNQYLKSVGAE
jgi:hypothetical protein